LLLLQYFSISNGPIECQRAEKGSHDSRVEIKTGITS
jgi:hypothetical protein